MRVERKYLNKKLREATENEWWTRYLKRASEQELLDFSGASSIEEFNSDICSSCEDLPGYSAKHIDWLIPKDEYFDTLSNDGYDIIELCEMDGKQFLGHVVGDRLYDIGDEVKKCCEKRQKGTGPNESLSENNDVIDFLKKIKFRDEFDFEEVGDWGISAWTSRPLLNFSNGFYIVQLDNDKLNKHFVIPDNETEDEFIHNRDSFIKRHFNDLNESIEEMYGSRNRYSIILKDVSGGLIVYAKGQIDAELTDEEAKEYGEPRGWRNYYNSRSEAVEDYNFIDGICKKYDISIWEHDSHTWGENDCVEIVGDSKNQVDNALNDLKGLFSFDISESLKESSYGGAFDIEDDQFFTRDDINEFGYDVADQFSAWAGSAFDLSDVYMDTPTKLHLEVFNHVDYEGYEANIKIDMRRIRSPKDLYRYEDEVLRQLKDAYFEYHAEDEMEI